MKKILFPAVLILLLCAAKTDKSIVVDKEEAKKAFNFINDIRTNPSKYVAEFKYDKAKIKNTKLIWNDTLAKVAEAKAYDMASRNYFGHTDPDGYGMNYFINKAGYQLEPKWLTNKANNYFESIAAGAKDGEDVVRILVVDANTPSLGHRKHLLGMDEWNSSLVDIGIGYVKKPGSLYGSYISVVIAKHSW